MAVFPPPTFIAFGRVVGLVLSALYPGSPASGAVVVQIASANHDNIAGDAAWWGWSFHRHWLNPRGRSVVNQDGADTVGGFVVHAVEGFGQELDRAIPPVPESCGGVRRWRFVVTVLKRLFQFHAHAQTLVIRKARRGRL